ncbi:MAG: DNA alkylation repair protein [Lachnospira sp.]
METNSVSFILNLLYENQDIAYADFQSKLIPTVERSSVIGVRTPVLRKLARELYSSCINEEFMLKLPHTFFEENQLHAFLLSSIKDYDKCMYELEKFLPYVDNWATCDQMSPKIFKKHLPDLIKHIEVWIKSDHEYSVRFAIKMLMEHFLDDAFDLKYAEMVASVKSDYYYVNMMVSWYFATALAKQYDSIITFFTKQRLSDWNHNKSIQKAVESYRIADDKKAYLKGLRVSKRV